MQCHSVRTCGTKWKWVLISKCHKHKIKYKCDYCRVSRSSGHSQFIFKISPQNRTKSSHAVTSFRHAVRFIRHLVFASDNKGQVSALKHSPHVVTKKQMMVGAGGRWNCKEFFRFYGKRRFVTAFINKRTLTSVYSVFVKWTQFISAN